MHIKLPKELDDRIMSVIKAVRQKQFEGKIELYNDEMKEMIDKFGEYDLILTGCRIVKSTWRRYLILPEDYIEEKDVPALRARMAMLIEKCEAEQ